MICCNQSHTFHCLVCSPGTVYSGIKLSYSYIISLPLHNLRPHKETVSRNLQYKVLSLNYILIILDGCNWWVIYTQKYSLGYYWFYLFKLYFCWHLYSIVSMIADVVVTHDKLSGVMGIPKSIQGFCHNPLRGVNAVHH